MISSLHPCREGRGVGGGWLGGIDRAAGRDEVRRAEGEGRGAEGGVVTGYWLGGAVVETGHGAVGRAEAVKVGAVEETEQRINFLVQVAMR